MPSVAPRSPSPTLTGDDSLDPQGQEGVPPGVTMSSVSFPNSHMRIYPFPAGATGSPPLRSKRRQVKNACTNCQKACKKCDDARPCLRCVKYGVADDCIDSQRKERKKGVKRGPYKKRDGKHRASSVTADDDSPPAEAIPHALPPPPPLPTGAVPAPGAPPWAPVGYPPPYYSQMPPMLPGGKPGEPAFYPMIYMPPPPPGHEGEVPYGSQPPPPHFYPAFMPYAPPYPTYMVPHPGSRDPPVMLPPPHFSYPPPHYPRSPSGGPSSGDEYRRDRREQLEEGRA